MNRPGVAIVPRVAADGSHGHARGGARGQLLPAWGNPSVARPSLAPVPPRSPAATTPLRPARQDTGAPRRYSIPSRAGRRPVQMPYGSDRLPVPARRVPVPAVASAAGLAGGPRVVRNLRRVLACAAADHLHQAAAILGQAPGADALLLGAAGAAEVLDALDRGARRLGAAPPMAVASGTADRLRRWGTALKRPAGPAARPARDALTSAFPPERRPVRPTTPHPTPEGSQPDQLGGQLAEVASALRAAPAPLDPAPLAVVLRGLAELCRLVQARGPEAGAAPPVLLRDNPVIAEALGMWATRLDCLARERQDAGDQGSQQR